MINLYDDSSSQPEEPRDPAWLRWLKFASIIVIPAVFLGLAFCGVAYFKEYNRARYHMAEAAQQTEDQVTGRLRTTFFLGAVIGGGLGLGYVIRCIIRKVDP